MEAGGNWVQESCARGDCAPAMGLGPEVGPVICGAIGEDGRLEYAVIGDPVNRAAKLQNQTKAEGVHALTTKITLESALAQGYVPRAKPVLLRGRQIAGIDVPLDLVAIR